MPLSIGSNAYFSTVSGPVQANLNEHRLSVTVSLRRPSTCVCKVFLLVPSTSTNSDSDGSPLEFLNRKSWVCSLFPFTGLRGYFASPPNYKNDESNSDWVLGPPNRRFSDAKLSY